MPIQPSGEASAPGMVEVYPEFVGGLKDLEGFSQIVLLYHLHKVRHMQLTVGLTWTRSRAAFLPRVRRYAPIQSACQLLHCRRSKGISYTSSG